MQKHTDMLDSAWNTGLARSNLPVDVIALEGAHKLWRAKHIAHGKKKSQMVVVVDVHFTL